MTTEEITDGQNIDKLSANLEKIEELSQRLMTAFSHKREVPASLQGPGPELYMKAATSYMSEMMANPSRLLEQQVGYWGRTLKHYAEAQEQLAKGKLEPPADNDATFVFIFGFCLFNRVHAAQNCLYPLDQQTL